MSQIIPIKKILLRDLKGLSRQIEAYNDDSSLWATPEGIKNSAGNLALHLTGNLRHFIGTILGSTGYVRDRDYEFSASGLSRDEVIGKIESAMTEVEEALDKLSCEVMDTEYPIAVSGVKISTRQFVTHLIMHFGYHLGQIDYHRRLVTGSSETVESVSVPELGD